MRWTLILLTLISFSTLAHAAAPLPPAVQAEINGEMKECSTHNAKFKKGFLTRKDINGDGKEDYILDFGQFLCGSPYSSYCGSGGCSTSVYVSTANGYMRVLNDTVHSVEFKTIGGRPAMLLQVHGSACGREGAFVCKETLYWNGSAFKKAN